MTEGLVCHSRVIGYFWMVESFKQGSFKQGRGMGRHGKGEVCFLAAWNVAGGWDKAWLTDCRYVVGNRQ